MTFTKLLSVFNWAARDEPEPDRTIVLTESFDETNAMIREWLDGTEQTISEDGIQQVSMEWYPCH